MTAAEDHGTGVRRAPLLDALTAAVTDPSVAFHMPGHRSGDGAPPLGLQALGRRMYELDRSEIGGLPYLHAPDRELADAQRLAADCFGAAETWFLVNGSTVGNQAALLASVGPGDVVLVQRAAHRSVHAGLVLSGATPAWVPSVFDDGLGGWFAPDLTEARRIAAEHDRIRLVHVTRPDYYGVATELRSWRRLADELDAILVVDEAHGSHLVLDRVGAPRPALELGADLVVQSTHKSLGAFTQASMLHLGWAADRRPSRRVDRDRVAQALGMLQSSSPFYPLLASLDAARAHVAANGEQLAATLAGLVAAARAGLAELPLVRPWPERDDLDGTKLVIDVVSTGVTGPAFAAALAAHGVVVELADAERVVFSLTIADTEWSIAALVDAVGAVARSAAGSVPRPADAMSTPPCDIPPRRLGLREAAQAASVAVDRTNCVGRIAAEFVMPYPPGIPVVVPGEEITRDVLATIDRALATGGRLVGPADASTRTLRVVP